MQLFQSTIRRQIQLDVSIACCDSARAVLAESERT